jgi:protein TonB
LLEEVSMSTRTTRAARAGCGLALVLSSALAVRAFPLSAPPRQDQKKETPKPAVPIEGAPEPAPGKRWFREQAPAPKSARAVGGGVPGGVVGGVPGGVAGGIDDEAQEKPMPGQAAPEKKTRKLVRKVEPAFPEDGKKLRGREDVILSITIEESGAVSDVKIVKGHPSFNESAVAAVKQWKFEPSDRSPAEATVTIRFVPPPPPPPPPKPQP